MDARVAFLNPTREQILPLLQRFAEVEMFGPGFQDEATLNHGLLRFLEGRPVFDILVMTEHITNSVTWRSFEDVSRTYRLNHLCYFPLDQLKYLRGIFHQACSTGLPRVATALETDYFSLSQAEIEVLSAFDLIVGFGNEFISPRDACDWLGLESFSHRTNDNWYEFVRTSPEKILSFPHLLSEDEVVVHDYPSSRAMVSVPGVRYARRQVARKQLRAAGLLAGGTHFTRRTAGAFSRLGVGVYSSRLGQRFLRAGFRKEIQSNRFSFTDGSALDWPLRKFFEIPANGAVLLCTPCNGFERLGFRSGHNSFIVSPDEVDSVAQDLIRTDTSRVAQNGARLMRLNHTVGARAPSVEMAFKRVLSGSYVGADWMDGTLILR